MVTIGLLLAAAIGASRFREAPRPAAHVQPGRPPPLQTARSSPSPPPVAPVDAATASLEEQRERVRVRAGSAPGATAAWAAALPAGDERRSALEAVALAWGDSDPAAAARWALDLPDAEERSLALACVAGEAVRAEPLLALELSPLLPESVRGGIVERAAMEWAASEPEAAVEWAREIPGDALREKVIAGIAIVWSDRDPVGGATLAASELPPGRLQDDSVVSVVQRWAQRAPADAAGWVLQFPEGALRDAAMECLAAHAPAGR